MKRLISSLVSFTVLVFPLLSQVDYDQGENEIVPVEALVLKKEQIPAPIVQAVNRDFKTGEAFKWGKFPYVLEKYGWIVSKSASNEKPERYEAYIKSADGSEVFAIYNPDGTIVQSKTIRKDAALPVPVAQKLAKSQYHDWNIIGDREVIKYYNTPNNVEEHFRITVEKNNQKKTISFKMPGGHEKS